MAERLTDFAVVLATEAASAWTGNTQVVADQVRHKLEMLGFDLTTQAVASMLGRLSRQDNPRA